MLSYNTCKTRVIKIEKINICFDRRDADWLHGRTGYPFSPCHAENLASPASDFPLT